MDKLEKYRDEVLDIFKYCKVKYANEPGELQNRLTMLNVYLARSGELKANIQYLYDIKHLAECEELIDLSPNKLREVLKGKLAQEGYAVTLADRLNSTITHQIDAIRSQLSFMKTELNTSNFQT